MPCKHWTDNVGGAMELGFTRKFKMPSKKTMNLYQPEFKADSKFVITLAIMALVLIIGILSKFFILDTYNQVKNIKSEIADLQATYDLYTKQQEGYDELKDEYYRYSETYSKDVEQLVDRITILELLDELKEGGYGSVTSTTITGNSVNIKVITKDLDTLSKLRLALESNPIVKSVVVYSANRSTGDVMSSVAFTCENVEVK